MAAHWNAAPDTDTDTHGRVIRAAPDALTLALEAARGECIAQWHGIVNAGLLERVSVTPDGGAIWERVLYGERVISGAERGYTTHAERVTPEALADVRRTIKRYGHVTFQ